MFSDDTKLAGWWMLDLAPLLPIFGHDLGGWHWEAASEWRIERRFEPMRFDY